MPCEGRWQSPVFLPLLSSVYPPYLFIGKESFVFAYSFSTPWEIIFLYSIKGIKLELAGHPGS